MVTFDPPQPAAQFASLAHPLLAEAWTSHPLETAHLMLRWTRDHDGDATTQLLALGIDTSQVARVEPAYQLPDGQVVGLTPHLLLRYRAGVDTLLANAQLRAHPDVRGLTHLLSGDLRIDLASLDALWPLQAWLWQQQWPHWCQPDFLVRMLPADPYTDSQFFLNNTGQLVDGNPATIDIDIDAAEAWAITQGDSAIIIAVFDNGLEAHEDFETATGTSRILPGYSIIGLGNGEPIVSQESHGMGCGGLIGASHNGIGVQGVAPNVRLLPIYAPLLLSVPISTVANGITWAWQVGGADVINCSWALPTCDSVGYPVLVQAIRDALTLGRNYKGTVMVFAAGNDTLACVRFPAMLDSTIAVGAIDLNGNPSVYANRGLALDVVAPSSGNDQNIRTIDRLGSDGTNVNGSNDLANLNYTRRFGGTSSATALTSGVAGLLLSVYPALTAREVQQSLRDGADDMGPNGLDADYGYGRLNALASLNEASAYGPLDAQPLALLAILTQAGVALTWTQGNALGDLHLERRTADQTVSLADWCCGQAPSQWLDPSPTLGWNLYRLSVTTTDGQTQYSAWQRVTVSEADWRSSQRLARQASGWTLTAPGLSSLRLYDLTGRLISQLAAESGQATDWFIPAPPVPGCYLLELRDHHGRSTRQKLRW
jgi:subtilisin family serine protease